MLETLNQIEQSGLESLQAVQDEEAVQLWKINLLGRSSPLMRIFDQLGSLPKDERPVIGRRANEVKRSLEGAFEAVSERIRQGALLQALAAESLDVTLPGRSTWRGRPHPATQSLEAISAVFVEMGFQIYRSREVELDEYNFQLLNFPPHHPAREMQDSFYVESGSKRGDNPIVLRTHTSPGQVRAMREISALNPSNPPAVRLILPGMCFRFEQVTARSEMQFNQIEGLAVGKQITFGDLKGTLSEFARRFFGPNVHSRFRASHFPFTEPSAEMDIECFVCGGAGCQVCKRSGWLEILGCGMVHPVVLSNGGYDPAIYTGFAFGMGPERVAMLRYKIEDIRSFWANDLRFLEQF
jgi:phenylalanyl-tRNA synthetase alpha chain